MVKMGFTAKPDMQGARPSGRSLEIILGDELQEMLDHFSAAFDIRIGVFDPFGEELVCGLGRGRCSFCAWLRRDLKLESRCLQCDREMFAKASRGSKLLVYRCHAGLAEAIQPLRLEGGELAGFFMIGQFRVEGEEPSKSIFDATARNVATRAAMRRLFNQVPLVKRSRLPHVFGLFSLIVKLASERRMLTMKGELLIGRIEQAATARLSRSLSLAEAARLVGRSPSSVSHLFKARLGISFKQRLLQLRLDSAERLLRGSSGSTVSEVAAACGFSSPFHFSRLFKKHRGVSPSTLKARPYTTSLSKIDVFDAKN